MVKSIDLIFSRAPVKQAQLLGTAVASRRSHDIHKANVSHVARATCHVLHIPSQAKPMFLLIRKDILFTLLRINSVFALKAMHIYQNWTKLIQTETDTNPPEPLRKLTAYINSINAAISRPCAYSPDICKVRRKIIALHFNTKLSQWIQGRRECSNLRSNANSLFVVTSAGVLFSWIKENVFVFLLA